MVSVPSDPDETVLLDRTATTAHQGGPLVAPGGVLGLSAGADSVVPTARFTSLLQTARSNAASGQLKTLGEVAVDQNHQFGAVTVQSAEPGSVVITTTEASQWVSLQDSATTPHVFVGPIGTYAFAFYSGGQLRQQGEFSVQPGTTTPFLIPAATAGDPQLEVQGSGGGFPVLWVVLGAAAAGVGAFLLLGGSPPTEDGTGTTTITINVP